MMEYKKVFIFLFVKLRNDLKIIGLLVTSGYTYCAVLKFTN